MIKIKGHIRQTCVNKLPLQPKVSGELLTNLQDACKYYNKAETTLKTNIRNGKFKVGKDVKKFGNTWVFNTDALEREYRKNNEPKIDYTNEKWFSVAIAPEENK